MTKDPSPLLGYNNNIRHKNRVFHIQTEDSGVRHPHIITHLFMDGGRILKSVKTSYAEHLGVEKMADLVRKMMKDQHKGMLIALRDGQFDVVIEGGEAPRPPKFQPATPSVAALTGSAPSSVADAADSSPVLPSPPTSSPAVESAPRPPPPSVRAVPARPPPVPAAPAHASAHNVPVAFAEPAELDFEDSRGPSSVPFDAPLDLQPPPANLFRQRSAGNYSGVGESPPAPPQALRGSDSKPGSGLRPPTRPPAGSRPPSLPPGAVVSKSPGLRSSSGPQSSRPTTSSSGSGSSGASSGPARPPPIPRTSSPPPPKASPPEAPRPMRRPAPAAVVTKAPESRYASARPAAIFGQTKPRGGSSIFGEDIISDKSLDEVIMSYLAEDIGGSGSESSPKSSVGHSTDPKRRK
jgi:hypothetical protein